LHIEDYSWPRKKSIKNTNANNIVEEYSDLIAEAEAIANASYYEAELLAA
jgi:hypothetical protein